MPNTQRLTLTARSAGDPVPDLTSLVMVHRAIRADLSRLTSLASPVIDEAAPPLQAEAVCRYTRQLLAAIRAHLGDEEGIIWPLIAATARQAVDLTLLTDDHQAIEAASHRTSRELACFAAEPGSHEAALRAMVGGLRDMADEHIADEESQLFPVMRRYLPAQDYRWCERQIMRRTPARSLQFRLPWLARHARRDELAPLLSAGGRRARVVLALNRPTYARLERQAFGTQTHEKSEQK